MSKMKTWTTICEYCGDAFMYASVKARRYCPDCQHYPAQDALAAKRKSRKL